MVLLLWLRDELFDHGIVHTVHRHTRRITRFNVDSALNALRKVDADAVRLDDWITVARGSLQWSSEEARLCFALCQLFFTNKGKAPEALPFIVFALFLFVQLYVPVLASSPVRQLSSTLWPSEQSGTTVAGHHHHQPAPAGVASSSAPQAHHPHLTHPRPSAGASSAISLSTPPPTSPSAPHVSVGFSSPGSSPGVSSSSPRSAGSGSGGSPHGVSVSSSGSGSRSHGPISPSSPRGLALNSRATEQAHRLQFVKKHIAEILEILYIGSGGESARATGSNRMTKTALSHLGFLVQCGSTTATKARDLALATPWFADGADETPAPESAPVSPAVLAEWLLSHLTVNEVLHPAVAQIPAPNAISTPVPAPFSLNGSTASPASPTQAAGASLPGLAQQAASPGSPATPGSAVVAVGGSAVVPSVACPPAHTVLCSREFEAVKVNLPTSQAVPKAESPVTPPIVISGIHRASMLEFPTEESVADDPLPTLRMDHCWDSFIYVLAPVSFATILGCSHCTIVVSAVSGSVLIEHCEDVRVIVAASTVRVSNSVDCLLHLHTPARPLVSGDCRGLLFAPHNAPHASLRANMRRCGLATSDSDSGVGNLWDSPLVLSSIAGPSSDGQSSASRTGAGAGAGAGTDAASPSRASGNYSVAAAQRQFKLLPTQSFALVTTPAIPPAVRASGQSNAQDTDLTLGAEAAQAPATTAYPAAREVMDDSSPMAGAAVPLPLPLPLPPPYAEALKARHEMVQKLRRSIRSESLTPAQRRELQYAVQAHFREWLVTSGSIRQVSDLVRVFRDSSKDGGAAHQLMMMPQQGGHFHPVHVHHLRRKSSSSSLGSAFSGSASSGNAAAAASPGQ